MTKVFKNTFEAESDGGVGEHFGNFHANIRLGEVWVRNNTRDGNLEVYSFTQKFLGGHIWGFAVASQAIRKEQDSSPGSKLTCGLYQT